MPLTCAPRFLEWAPAQWDERRLWAARWSGLRLPPQSAARVLLGWRALVLAYLFVTAVWDWATG
jgi:hypothetical protein